MREYSAELVDTGGSGIRFPGTVIRFDYVVYYMCSKISCLYLHVASVGESMNNPAYTHTEPTMIGIARENTSLSNLAVNTLESLRFDNVYGALPAIFYSRHSPEPLENQYLIHFNPQVADLLELDPGELARPDFVSLVSGTSVWPGTDPLAMCYAGHQFGHYVPRLGDGRALLLGQIRTRDNRLWDLQLKGSGRTLYSRQGDGKAVLRSTIREYLCSAAMTGLDIPTTRALALFGSDEHVYREQIETGAMLIRVAPGHLRFGSFEFLFYQNRYDGLKILADFALEHYYPELKDNREPYLCLFSTIVELTARLIAQWQSVGFCHGVMNSDNMSIHGITIDYGPFGFMDRYRAGHICNHSDHTGRYAFNRQPDIGLFNLSCLAQAMLPLFDPVPEQAAEKATAELMKYGEIFGNAWLKLKRAKLGLTGETDEDGRLYDDLLAVMERDGLDFTHTLRALCSPDFGGNGMPCSADMTDWLDRYHKRLEIEETDVRQRRRAMENVNPKYVLRNWMAEVAIRKARDEMDYSEIDQLTGLLNRPFDEQPEFQAYAEPPPDWAAGLAVSCSS